MMWQSVVVGRLRSISCMRLVCNISGWWLTVLMVVDAHKVVVVNNCLSFFVVVGCMDVGRGQAILVDPLLHEALVSRRARPWRGGGAATTDRRRRRGARLRGAALCRQPGIARGGLSLLLLFLVDPPVQLSQCEVQGARDVGLDAAGTAGTAADGTYRRRRPGYCVVGRPGTACLTTTHSMRRTVTVVGLVAGLRGVVGRLLRWVVGMVRVVTGGPGLLYLLVVVGA